MKKLLSILLSLVLVIAALPLAAVESSALTDGDWEYTVSNNEATVTGYTGSLTDIAIPSTLGGYSVTAIGNNAFRGKTSITGVTIPDSVTSIGNQTFFGCGSLSSVTIPDSVTNIGNQTFFNCGSLSSVTIGDSVTSIGNEAFKNCTSLSSIYIPDSVTSIGEEVFTRCYSLRRITVDNDNTAYHSFGGVLFNKSMTEIICYPEAKTARPYTIPESVTSIGAETFLYSDVFNIIISESVTSIGSNAFNDYTCLYGKHNTYAETYANNNSEIYFYAFEDLFTYTVSNNEATITGYLGPESHPILPSSLGGYEVTGINAQAFESNNNISIIEIPDGVRTIGDGAFNNCPYLTSVTIPESVTEIGANAFSNCYSSFVMHGADNSCAETYANDNNIPFVAEHFIYTHIEDDTPNSCGLLAITDGYGNSYENGSTITVATGGASQLDFYYILEFFAPDGYGCEGTITNGTNTIRINDRENSVSFVPEGNVTIDLHLYSRSDYTTLYFRNTNNSSYFTQKYLKTETSFIFPENSFTNSHGIFNNWNTASDGSGTAYRPNEALALPSADTSYYAVWDEAYFLSFNKNGGTGSMDKIGVVTSKPTPIVPECGFTRNGYVFTGWNTKSNGSGTTYQPNDTIILSANTTLYAQWAQAYTVYLHSNFGSDTTIRQEIIRGQTANIMPNPFSRPGYRFIGWTTNADGSGTSYSDGETITPTGSVYLYAQWERDYDINDDGVEDINDIGFILSVSVGNITDATAAELAKADLNSDGVVDAFDAAELDRLMEAAGLFDWYAADSYYCMDGAGYMCLINGREYYKVNPGKTIIGTAYYECYNGFRGTGPILVSTDPDAVANNCSYYLPDIFEYTVSFEYLGTTWYAAGSDYLWENDHTSQRKLDGFYNSLEEAAIALLNTAGVAFGNPPASTYPWEAANVEYLMADTGNMCIINGRDYYKINTGRAIIGTAYYYVPSANWSGTGPILVSTDPDTVVNNCSYLPSDLFEYSISFEYLGLTWYAAESGYLWEGNHSSQRKLDGSYNSLEAAAKALIDAAGVTVNSGGSTTPVNTTNADKGDVNADGEIGLADYAMIRAHISGVAVDENTPANLLSTDYLDLRYDTLKTQYPEGTIITQQYYCADYDGDKAVDAFDLFYLDKRINNIA